MFYFAWCEDNQEFDDSVLREDEIVFAFDLAHREGQIPTLTIDIKNPHIGLLAPGRAQWAWLSYDDGNDIYPLFYGRLVSMPTNLLGETVTLHFLARPDDYLAQKQDVADGLRIEPYYDPIWITQDKRDDPDTVLETYAMTWHVDRITHELSVSDILFGEDGTAEFFPEDAFYDSVSISFAQSPQTQVVFDGTVQWTQAGTGLIRLPDVSLSAWNGQQIINDWPKPGSRLDGGWSVEESAMTNWSDQTANNNPIIITVGGGTAPNAPGPVDSPVLVNQDPLTVDDLRAVGVTSNVLIQMPTTAPGGGHARSVSMSYTNPEKEHNDGDTLSVSESASYNELGGLGGSVVSTSVSGNPGVSLSVSISWVTNYGTWQTAPETAPSSPIVINPDGSTSGGEPITVPSLFGQLLLRYNLSFPRSEKMHFVMNSDIQPIVLLPPDESVNQIKLAMHGSDLGLPLDPGGVAPIGDPGRSAFFPTDRGLLAMQYPMLLARAHLAQAARAAKVSFNCTFERAIALSCRMNALLHDPRLPGGKVIGKITEYHLKVDGDHGELLGTVQIESIIGKGTSIVTNEGMPTYVEEGYAVVGYQFYSDADVTLPSGDAAIVMPEISMTDSGGLILPLTFEEAVVAFQVHQGTPFEVLLAGNTTTVDPTWLEIVLNPVTGRKFETDYDLGISTLVLPKLIDLAAPSA